MSEVDSVDEFIQELLKNEKIQQEQVKNKKQVVESPAVSQIEPDSTTDDVDDFIKEELKRLKIEPAVDPLSPEAMLQNFRSKGGKDKDVVIPDDELSGATGFETGNLALKRATNDLTPFQQFGDFVSGVTSKENLEKAFLRSAESEKMIGEKAARTTLSAGVGITQTPLELVELVGNVVARERVAKIKKSELGQAYANIIEAIDPLAIQEEQVDEAVSTDPIEFKLEAAEAKRKQDEIMGEKIAANLLQFVGGTAGAIKLGKEFFELLVNKVGKTKSQKIALELERQLAKLSGKTATSDKIIKGGSLASGTVGSIATGMELTDSDEMRIANQIADKPEIFNDSWFESISPEIIEIAERYAVRPSDTEAEAQLKDFIVETGITIPLVALPSFIIFSAKYGGKGASLASKPVIKAASQIVKSEPVTKTAKVISENLEKVTDPIKTGGKVVIESTGMDIPIKAVTERVAKINTGAGRFLRSDAALPKDIARSATERKTSVAAAEFETKVLLKDLKELQKREGVSDDAFEAWFNTGKGDVTENFKTEFAKIKTLVDANERKINQGLGLTDEAQIGIRSDGQDFYVTRTFKANTDPKYLAEAIDAIKGKGQRIVPYLPGRGQVPTKLMKAIENAKKEFRKIGFTDEKEIEKQLLIMVQNVGRKDDTNILVNLFNGTKFDSALAGQSAKVLRQRKNLSEPILEILGRQTNPYTNLQNTLVNQNKLLSELKYFKDVERFVRKNLDKKIKLPGLFPMLPSKKVIAEGPGGVAFRSSPDNLVKLEKLAEEGIGKFGGNSPKVLENIFSSDVFASMIRDGLDAFNPLQRNWLMNQFSKASSFVQAKETLFDFPAYVLNTQGMVSSLVGNGQFFNPKNYKRAVTEIDTLFQQITLNNPKAIEKLAMLKRFGVIDQDVTGAMIEANARSVKTFLNKAKGADEGAYAKIMQKFGRAYGQPDLYGKLVAFEAESAALRKAFPMNKLKYRTRKDYDKFINQEAAQIVRDTMPTYGIASPAAREFARLPFIGNYVLFPSELFRTTKNMFKYGAKDVIQGTANGNARQVATGFRRLAGLSTVMVGYDTAINLNNRLQGVNDIVEKAYGMSGAPWQKGSRTTFIEPLVQDETAIEKLTLDSVRKQFPREEWDSIKSEQGYSGTYNQFIKEILEKQKSNFTPFIKTRTLNSSTFSMYDAIQSPFRLSMAKLVGSGTISDEEIENAWASAAGVVTGAYTSPKALAEAAISVITGRDRRTGKSIYDEAVGATTYDRLMNALDKDSVFIKTILGGTGKVIRDYITIENAEEVLGAGKALSSSGFPVTREDLRLKVLTGSGSSTDNVNKRVGFDLSKKLKPIAATKINFENKIKGLNYKLQTPEDVNDLIEEYKNLQKRKRKGMQDLTKRVGIYRQIPYTRIYRNKDGKIEREQKVLGSEGVLAAATNDFFYTPDETLLQTAAQDLVKEADTRDTIDIDSLSTDLPNIIFMPDNPFSKKGSNKWDVGNFYLKAKRKGFSKDLLDKLISGLVAAYEEEISVPLFDSVDTEKEQQ